MLRLLSVCTLVGLMISCSSNSSSSLSNQGDDTALENRLDTLFAKIRDTGASLPEGHNYIWEPQSFAFTAKDAKSLPSGVTSPLKITDGWHKDGDRKTTSIDVSFQIHVKGMPRFPEEDGHGWFFFGIHTDDSEVERWGDVQLKDHVGELIPLGVTNRTVRRVLCSGESIFNDRVDGKVQLFAVSLPYTQQLDSYRLRFVLNGMSISDNNPWLDFSSSPKLHIDQGWKTKKDHCGI